MAANTKIRRVSSHGIHALRRLSTSVPGVKGSGDVADMFAPAGDEGEKSGDVRRLLPSLLPGGGSKRESNNTGVGPLAFPCAVNMLQTEGWDEETFPSFVEPGDAIV